MKRLAFLTILVLNFALFSANKTFATVTITAPSLTNSADLAVNGAAPLATSTLGNIVITEVATNDFAPGTGVTLILTAPTGWQFNPGVGSVSFQNSRNITSASITITTTNLTVTLSLNSTANKIDALTISGIQVQATEGGNVPGTGTILRTSANPGTASIAGITNDSTSLGSLSQSLRALDQKSTTL